MFVDREEELAFFNSLLKRQHPTRAQMILLYGRRRVGKTVLVRRWAETTALPTVYWAAETETAPLQRRKLFAQMLRVPAAQAPVFDSWADLWPAFAKQIGERPQILILILQRKSTLLRNFGFDYENLTFTGVQQAYSPCIMKGLFLGHFRTRSRSRLHNANIGSILWQCPIFRSNTKSRCHAKSDDKSSYDVCGTAAKAWRTTEQLARAKARAG
jgi:hypothetical protein